MSNELDFLVDDANSTDQDTVHIAGVGYPFIQWIVGDDKADEESNLRFHGGFFAPATSIDLSGVAGWLPSYIKRNDKDGKPIKIEGSYAKRLNLTVVSQRHCYQVAPKGGQVENFSHTQYEQAEARATVLRQVDSTIVAKKKSQFLIVIKGIEQPVMLTTKGVVAKAMSGQTGLLQQFDRTVMAYVAAELKRAGSKNLLPMRRFWLDIGVPFDGKGQPIFAAFGPKGGTQKNLVVPSLTVPNPITGDYIKSIHVGEANRDRFDKLYFDAVEWSKAWDTKGGSTAAATTTAPAVDPETASALADM